VQLAHTQIIVLGAGRSGLAAARLAAARGGRVTLLDSAPVERFAALAPVTEGEVTAIFGDAALRFDGEADLDSFARQVVAEAGTDPNRLAAALARLTGERAKARMRLLHEARLAEVTGVVTGVIETLSYFIDNAKFGDCSTFLLGGQSFPGTDQQVMSRLTDRLGAAVRSGQRGEKDWVELSAAEQEDYGAQTVSHLLANGYTAGQLQSMTRLDTTDPAEMETNCRFSRDLFAYLVEAFPPEVAASIYIAEL